MLHPLVFPSLKVYPQVSSNSCVARSAIDDARSSTQNQRREGQGRKAGHGTASGRKEAGTDTRSTVALEGWQFNRLLVDPSYGPRIGPSLSQSVKFERSYIQSDQRAILCAQNNGHRIGSSFCPSIELPPEHTMRFK